MDLRSEVMKISKISPHLYLGSVKHPREETDEFKKLEIDVVINCCNDYTHRGNKKFVYENYPIDDGVDASISKYLDPIADSIHNHISNQSNIYVHCLHGRSRSVSILIYYLIKYENMSYDQAYTKILSIRPMISPNSNFIQEICKYI